MIWSSKVPATPANARRRLSAAIDALDAADVLLVLIPRSPGLAETRNARAWASKACDRLDAVRRIH
jgi:hypothetical protein